MERLITRSAGQRKSKTKLMKNLTKKTMTFSLLAKFILKRIVSTYRA